MKQQSLFYYSIVHKWKNVYVLNYRDSHVNVDLSGFIFNSIASTFDRMTQPDTTTSLGIPLTASMTEGFTVGLAIGFVNG